MRKKRRPHKPYYPAPGGVTATDSRQVAFIKNLHRLMLRKGWKQSDLAQEAEKHMPKGKPFGRHLPSSYLTGKTMPSPMMLDAMAKALGVPTTEIIPEGAAEFVGAEPASVRIEMMPSGKAQLYLDIEIDAAKALEIMAIVNDNRR